MFMRMNEGRKEGLRYYAYVPFLPFPETVSVGKYALGRHAHFNHNLD